MTRYELLTDTSKVVTWTGIDGPDAALRWIDAHRHTTRYRNTSIIAWRSPRTGVYVVHPNQIKG